MACILHIETSTKACSLALSVSEKVVFERIDLTSSSHVARLGVFVSEAIEEARKNNWKIEAVAVGAGPGSYTGLRIGVSLAKGLCYGLEIPLIAIPSLKIMAAQSLSLLSPAFCPESLCPMIDARRMEVYAAVYTLGLNTVRDVRADIVDENTYREYLSKGKVLFFGDGSAKCKPVIHSPNALFMDDIHPLATAMPALAEDAFRKKEFVDVAYFEPFYLKEFRATVPKNRVLGDTIKNIAIER